MARRQRQINQAPKSRITAAILAFFLGSFGVHKFYLREAGAGVFYIMLFVLTTNVFSIPVSAILGLIDGMRLLGMSDERFDQKYNRGMVKYDSRSSSRSSRRSARRQQRKTSEPQVRRRKVSSRSNPFKKSGIKKYKDFDLEGAIEDFNQGLEISPEDSSLFFNLACAYSLTEQKEKAFKHIALAVQYGFKDFDKILTHDDLAFVRIQKEFDDFKANDFKMVADKKPQQENNPASPENITDDILLSQLNKLAELRKKGLLSEREFELERKKLMRR